MKCVTPRRGRLGHWKITQEHTERGEPLGCTGRIPIGVTGQAGPLHHRLARPGDGMDIAVQVRSDEGLHLFAAGPAAVKMRAASLPRLVLFISGSEDLMNPAPTLAYATPAAKQRSP